MTADDVIRALTAGAPCPEWIRAAAVIADPPMYLEPYSTTAVNFFPEVTVRFPAVKTARRSGKEYDTLQRRRLDLVGLVQTHYKNFEPVAIGVEIKVAEHDLVSDHKMMDYLAFCHLFYLAVPPALKQAAEAKLYGGPDPTLMPTAGLLLVEDDSVTISQAPRLTHPTDTHLKQLYAELLLRPFKLAKKSQKTFVEFV